MKADRIIQTGIFLMLFAFVGALYFALHEHVVNVGDKAPDFSIRADNGKTITVHDFGGKLLILNFWASWCEPCVFETPSLNRLQSILGSKGLVVLGISQDADPQAYRNFLARFKVTYMTARAPDKEIQLNYGTYKIPESYLIDQSGRVVEKIISDTNWASEQMVQHVQSLL